MPSRQLSVRSHRRTTADSRHRHLQVCANSQRHDGAISPCAHSRRRTHASASGISRASSASAPSSSASSTIEVENRRINSCINKVPSTASFSFAASACSSARYHRLRHLTAATLRGNTVCSINCQTNHRHNKLIRPAREAQGAAAAGRTDALCLRGEIRRHAQHPTIARRTLIFGQPIACVHLTKTSPSSGRWHSAEWAVPMRWRYHSRAPRPCNLHREDIADHRASIRCGDDLHQPRARIECRRSSIPTAGSPKSCSS